MEHKESSPGAVTGPVVEPVVIFTRWCKGCGICVEFCPRDVIEMTPEGIAKVVAPDKCTRCQLCEILCPDFAVTVAPREAKARVLPGRTGAQTAKGA